VSALVEEESRLLSRAFEMSRDEAQRHGVDILFAQVQALQVERGILRREIGNVLGTHRMHVASEVWREGVYDYRDEVGAPPVRVRVVAGPLGLQVCMPGPGEPMRIELFEGRFDGPMSADDAGTHAGETAAPTSARRRPACAKASKKKPG
jgi:hypothetical protein